MRTFSAIALTLALAASANAAALSKREISAAVTLCINDIIAVENQLALVKADVDVFTSASGYAGALAIHAKEQTLETLLKKAGTDCCAVTSVVSDEEAVAVLDVVEDLVPQVEGALTSISDKKSQFDAIVLATTLVKGDIGRLHTQTSALDTCLVAVTPSLYLTEANGYVDRIETAFEAAETVYGI